MNHDPSRAARSKERRAFLVGKRVLDVVVGTVALLLTLPMILLTALLVLVCDGRPILFRQERVGRCGEPFTILKFRTMVGGAERMLDDLASRNERRGPLFKITKDPRVTRLGRFLRDSSIDELPQLFNVLRGDMSLVGPRPALAHESAAFGAAHAAARVRVRPGITGLWQVKRTRRRGADFQEWIKYDLEYVDRSGWGTDLKIILATFSVLLRGSASHRESS
jgi:lipopolysaccharide/colanic/teichoic acid biosynthesis glycosyltransferase